ncbi:MAG: hypothetical protein WBK67_02400 [Minisyncoccales bacterium]
MKELVENIKESEGFKGVVYKCSEGYDTIGYGTRLPLVQEEAELLLEYRLKAFIKELEQREPFVNKLPLDKQEILAEMAYQMSVGGLLKFKMMWKALKAFDYQQASKEMLNSLWARQMHEADMRDGRDGVDRAERLAQKMREV